MAVASFFAPLVGIGSIAVMVRDAARSPGDLPRHLGEALLVWMWSAPLILALAFVISVQLLPNALPPYAIGAIVIADVACTSLIELLARAYQAIGRTDRFGQIMASLVLARLAALIITFAEEPRLTSSAWSLHYGAASALTLVLVIGITFYEIGCPQIPNRPLSHLIRSGFPFAFAGSAMRIQAEINKPIVGRLDSLMGVGVFSAAQRCTDMIQLPLTSLIDTLIPRVYQSSYPGKSTLKLGIFPLILAAIGGSALAAGADWLPWLLGPSFEQSIVVTRQLAALPALVVLRTLLAIVVGAHGQQHYFLPAYTIGALAAIALTSLWVPTYGMAGAVAAMYSTEALLVIFLGASLLRRHA